MLKTKAAILYQLNRPLRVEEIIVPDLKNGQVLVKMLACGLCRSQLNEIKGYKGEDPFLPHLLGHEGSGEVIKTGGGVTKVRKGDRVVLSWIKGQGCDIPSTIYLQGQKRINSGAVACLSEYTIASENRVVKVSKKIPPMAAALLGCAIPTGAGMVLNTLKVKNGSSLAVIGVGGIGAAVILAAKMAGVQRIIGIDILKRKLDFAKSLGATNVLNASEKTFSSQLNRLREEGIDYAVECSGAGQAMELAFAVVKDRGRVVIAGNLKKGSKISIDPFDLIKGKRITGTWGGETNTDVDIPKYARAYLSGKLKLDQLITQQFCLSEVNRAFSVLEKGGVGRVMVRFE